MIRNSFFPLLLATLISFSQAPAQDSWGKVNPGNNGWAASSPKDRLGSWEDFFEKPENDGGLPGWRIGADTTGGFLGLYTKDSRWLHDPYTGNIDKDARFLGVFARIDVAKTLDAQTEFGFRSHSGLFLANDEAVENGSGIWVPRPRTGSDVEITAGGNVGIAAMDVSTFFRYYLKPMNPGSPETTPWLEFGLGTLDYLRIGGSFEEQDSIYYDPLVDTPFFQIGEFNFELDLDVGMSYFLSSNISLDGRMNIASWNEKSVWTTPWFTGDPKFNYLFDGTDPEITFSISVWF